MGFWFTLEKPSDDAGGEGYALNGYQMNYVRLIMIEAGVIAGDGFEAALREPGLEISADTLPTKTFMSNNGWHITVRHAAFIAVRLRRAVERDVIPNLLQFFDDDDCPRVTDVQNWVDQFAAFNELAAQRDGYYVS